jgi:hypothetical protein
VTILEPKRSLLRVNAPARGPTRREALHRTTRSVVPTEAGARLLERLDRALAEMEAALDVVNGFRDGPAGSMRRDAHGSGSSVNSSWGCDTPRRAYRPTETRRRFMSPT